MTAFTLSVKMDNAAFDDGAEGHYELASILEKLAQKLGDAALLGRDTGSLMDVNGNTVGSWKIEGADLNPEAANQ